MKCIDNENEVVFKCACLFCNRKQINMCAYLRFQEGKQINLYSLSHRECWVRL